MNYFVSTELAKHPHEVQGAFLALVNHDHQNGNLEGMEFLKDDGKTDLCLFDTPANQQRLEHWHRIFRRILQKPNETVPFDLRHVPDDFIRFLQAKRKQASESSQSQAKPSPSRARGKKPNIDPPNPEPNRPDPERDQSSEEDQGEGQSESAA